MTYVHVHVLYLFTSQLAQNLNNFYLKFKGNSPNKQEIGGKLSKSRPWNVFEPKRLTTPGS